MPDLVIDFYGARPAPSAVKAAGYKGVMFYSRNPADPKPYLNAGLWVSVIFEYQANQSLQGAGKGAADGILFANQLTSIGQPHGTLVTVNLADFAPTPGDLSAIEAYWNAFHAQTAAWFVLPYGTGWLAEQMGGEDWQNAMNDNGVLGSTVVPQAALYQRVAHTLPLIAGCQPGDYDEDVVIKPLPWWGMAAPAPTPTPAPAPAPAPAPSPGTHVYTPPLLLQPIASSLEWPHGGVILLGKDGSIYSFGGSPFLGSANGQPYFAGRTAASVVYRSAVAGGYGEGYTIIDTAGEQYRYDGHH